MNDMVREFIPVFEFLCACSGEEQKSFIHKLEISVIKFLLDLLLNVVCGNIVIDAHIKAELKPYKRQIDFLLKSARKNLKKSIKYLNKRPALFCSIFQPLISVARDIITL